MTFSSEIRHSQIMELLEKVQNKNYGQYLLRINVEKARAFTSKSISFDFPVTALIGPNGGGKTTMLGAAACAYLDTKPSRFFSKSGRFDASMQNWKFEHEMIDRAVRRDEPFRRTAKFTNYRWTRDAVRRAVQMHGVSRTVPATERPEMLRCVGAHFDVEENQISAIPPEACQAVASILDKDVSDFKFLSVDTVGRVTLIAGTTGTGDAYSEFHFGAGESSIIRMVISLEAMPENSLVLIEEIENGLHPIATIRLVEYLIDLAYRRKIQTIFTTHSNDALKPLPSKAIWAAVNGELYQGKLDIGSLRAISGQVDSRLVIFVEDKFAKLWVEELLRSDREVAMDAISVHAMEGDGTALKVHLAHNLNPSVQQTSICILDGDSRHSADPDNLVFKLPGESPELFIFSKVAESLAQCSMELSVALLSRPDEEQRVIEVIRSVRNTNRDSHLLFSQVGRMLRMIPEERVKEAFISIWAKYYSDDFDAMIDAFRNL
ncbi:ATP-dependent nuclease, partial [Robbsia andropogonis]|uniref:ATP-dependent nuclease n=2 Tax=Robbsia andropogonis TaxID=28092 RepID=UPI0020A0007D